MHETVRLRFTVIFVLITALVYLVTSGFSIYRFWFRINATLDEEISTVAAETMTHIVCQDGKPQIDMSKAFFEHPISLQVYDTKGSLLQHIGAPGSAELLRSTADVTGKSGRKYRSMTQPIQCPGESKQSGFLQVQVSTRQRDTAIKHYLETMLIIAPFLLVGLAIVGSYFAGWAVRPIADSMLTLRQFLEDAGHELGTPLAILRSTADNLSLDVAGIPAAEERIDIFTRTIERMAKLVSDMTLLAKLESAELSYAKVPLDFQQLVQETVSNFKELFAGKNVTLLCESAEPCSVKGDKSALERVLNNLLQNAMRYTNEGGTVTVRLMNKENSTVVLTVADTGIGIPAESLKRIFDRFHRVEKARSRAAGGSGLGLAIVRATLESHGGSISVESEEGKGSKFSVMLPSCRA